MSDTVSRRDTEAKVAPETRLFPDPPTPAETASGSF
jgi:hypothetical protein